MHMFVDGKWNAPPPDYACIQHTTKEGRSVGSNLDSYRIMDEPVASVVVSSLDDDSFRSPYGLVLAMKDLLRITT